MSDLETDYAALELLQQEYNVLEQKFYSCRYQFWRALHAIKQYSPLIDSYKTYEAKIRRDCKKRQRKNYYGKRPRGTQLDHVTPVLYCYCLGITDLDQINGRENTKWIPRAVNRLKGISRGRPSVP